MLFVYYSYTNQTKRVLDAMADVLQSQGCGVTFALIEFTDPRYVRLSRTAREGMGWPTGDRYLERVRRPQTGGCSVQVELRALSRPSRIRSSPNANSSP